MFLGYFSFSLINFTGEYKRFKGSEYGYTFVYPKEWVGDTAVELAKAQRRAKALDYTMKSGRKSTNTLPDAGKYVMQS